MSVRSCDPRGSLALPHDSYPRRAPPTFGTLAEDGSLSPEQRLYLAQLRAVDRAIFTVRVRRTTKGLKAENSPYRDYPTRDEARRWVMRVDETPHGFDFTCRALGRNPADVRTRLLAGTTSMFAEAALLHEDRQLVHRLGYGHLAKRLREHAP